MILLLFSRYCGVIILYGHMCNNILALTHKPIAMTVSTMHFLIEIRVILKVIKSYFEGSYDKQNVTLVIAKN